MPPEVGVAEVGAAEVGAAEVGAAEVGVSEVEALGVVAAGRVAPEAPPALAALSGVEAATAAVPRPATAAVPLAVAADTDLPAWDSPAPATPTVMATYTITVAASREPVAITAVTVPAGTIWSALTTEGWKKPSPRKAQIGLSRPQTQRKGVEASARLHADKLSARRQKPFSFVKRLAHVLLASGALRNSL
jgi:hypothetical protein